MATLSEASVKLVQVKPAAFAGLCYCSVSKVCLSRLWETIPQKKYIWHLKKKRTILIADGKIQASGQKSNSGNYDSYTKNLKTS